MGCVWLQVAEMTGHMSRVLHLAQSPDGVTVCSAAADETLRFWKCFAEAAPAKVRFHVHDRKRSYLILSVEADWTCMCPCICG